MEEYIVRDEVIRELERRERAGDEIFSIRAMKHYIKTRLSADVAPARHGQWILEVHNEKINYRWSVTAKCSACYDEQKEIWSGFFPGVSSSVAKYVALKSAESVKLSNYCPNCGAKMD